MTEPRQRIKHIPVVVADVVQETADTVTLLLDAGDDPRDYKAGQYVSIDPHQFPAIKGYAAFLEDNKGRKEPPRAYSMVSTPDERYLAITVKEELYDKTAMKYPPLLSPFLVHHPLKGARMEVTGYAGGYHLPDDIANRTDHVVHLCAGSGSVPNVSMIKWGLANVPALRQTFIYSNKTWNDIIYRDELARMVAAHPERLRVVHALTREPEIVPLHRHGAARPRLARPDPRAAPATSPPACSSPAARPSRCGRSAPRRPRTASRRPASWSRSTPRCTRSAVPKDHFREEAFG